MKVNLYNMEMKFELFMGLKKTDPLMDLLGYNAGTEIAKQTVTISQTLPFIPDEEYIEKVKGVLIEGYETDSLIVIKCEFKGYSKLLEVQKEVDDPEKDASEEDMDLE